MKYDDASWHYEGDFPKGLPPEAGATHIGLFLAWAMHRGLVAPALREVSPAAFEAVLERRMTGTEFLLQHCDEKLIDDDLSEEGSAFATAYYEQTYLTDYCTVLVPYDDPDTWENFDKLAPLLDERLHEWRRTQ